MPPASARSRARITGAVYLLYFLTAIAGLTMVNRGLPTAGLIVNLISAGLYAALTVLLFYVFKPVNASLSALAAVISLAGCAVTVLNLFHLATTVSPLLFFGPYCLLLGYLILKSTFLPRILGGLLVLAGAGWLIFVTLPHTSHVARYIEGLGILAEGLFMLWLLLFGVTQDSPT
jgi:Domain of unknown function (DUF4386)